MTEAEALAEMAAGHRLIENLPVRACPHYTGGQAHDHVQELIPCAKCIEAGCRRDPDAERRYEARP